MIASEICPDSAGSPLLRPVRSDPDPSSPPPGNAGSRGKNRAKDLVDQARTPVAAAAKPSLGRAGHGRLGAMQDSKGSTRREADVIERTMLLDRRRSHEQAAAKHAAAGLAQVSSGDYAGEHWLASFAVYLLSTPVPVP